MSTNATVGDTANSAQSTDSSNAGGLDIAIKPENVKYNVYVKLDTNGKVIADSIQYTSSEKQIEKLNADATVTLGKTQTLKTYKVGSIQGLIDLIDDEDEVINILNAGLRQKQNAKIAAFLTDFDHTTQVFVNEQTDDTVDVRPMLQEATQRRNLSPLDRALKALAQVPGFSKDQIQSVIAQLQAASQ